MKRIAIGICVAWFLGTIGGVSAEEPKPGSGPRVVFVVHEDEYKADQSLPVFARWLSEHHGCRTTVLLGSAGGIQGLDALKTADVMVLFMRRKALPKEQLDAIRAYLDAGKPLVSLRTSCHAFSVGAKGKAPAGTSQWPTFDVDVLGCHYTGHLGNKAGTDVANAPEAAGHPVLLGVTPGKWHSTGSLYKVLPVDPDAKVLMTGRLGDHVEPVAWTRTYHGGRVFSTTLGHIDDFAQPQFHKMLVNAIDWAAGK